MEWRDQAVLIATRRHGESGLVIHVLSEHHGRHAGLVPGGGSRKRRGALQVGNQLDCRWRARLAEHLGTFSVELVRARAGPLLADGPRLAALSAACALLDVVLPERQPHASIYHGFVALLDSLGEEALAPTAWGAGYVRWEVGVLRELGFGLDLSCCAATGSGDDLAWVSPRTGRAVSAAAGAPFAGRLLRLPGFLVGGNGATAADVSDGLSLTGHFLGREAAALPAARDRLAELFRRTPISGG